MQNKNNGRIGAHAVFSCLVAEETREFLVWADFHQLSQGEGEVELHLTTDGSDGRLIVARIAKEIARSAHLLDHPESCIQNCSAGRPSGNYSIGRVRIRVSAGPRRTKPYLVLLDSIAFVLGVLGSLTCLHLELRPLVALCQSHPRPIVIGEMNRRVPDALGLERSRRKFEASVPAQII